MAETDDYRCTALTVITLDVTEVRWEKVVKGNARNADSGSYTANFTEQSINAAHNLILNYE